MYQKVGVMGKGFPKSYQFATPEIVMYLEKQSKECLKFEWDLKLVLLESLKSRCKF